MSKKDEILENIDMIKKFIFIMLPALLTMISYLFLNIDKLSIWKTIILIFGIIFVSFFLIMSLKFWKKNKKELRKIKK